MDYFFILFCHLMKNLSGIPCLGPVLDICSRSKLFAEVRYVRIQKVLSEGVQI